MGASVGSSRGQGGHWEHQTEAARDPGVRSTW